MVCLLYCMMMVVWCIVVSSCLDRVCILLIVLMLYVMICLWCMWLVELMLKVVVVRCWLMGEMLVVI